MPAPQVRHKCNKAKEETAASWSSYASTLRLHLDDVTKLEERMRSPGLTPRADDPDGAATRAASDTALAAATALRDAEKHSLEARRAHARSEARTMSAVVAYLGKQNEPGLGQQAADTQKTIDQSLKDVDKAFEDETQESTRTFGEAQRAGGLGTGVGTICGDL